MAGDKDQKTEKPTAKRRREARRDGQLPRSADISAWAGLLLASFLISHTFTSGEHLGVTLLGSASVIASNPSETAAVALLGRGLRGAVATAAPLLLALPVLGVVASVAQTGGVVLTAKRLAPDFKAIDPRKGVKRMVSGQAGWQAVKQVLKLVVLGLVSYSSVRTAVPLLANKGGSDLMSICGVVAGRALGVLRTVAAAGLLIAAVDYGVARRKVMKDMRMSKEEIKEEHKSSDGNPMLKGAIRRRMRAASRMRMIAAVASADAVVVNPTHYAVAVKYTAGTGAPRVVAKGVDGVALRIKAEARERRVPIVEDVPLARALHAAVRIDQEIPTELYEAVARLLSFVYTLKRQGRVSRIDGEGHRPPAPLLGGSAASAAA